MDSAPNFVSAGVGKALATPAGGDSHHASLRYRHLPIEWVPVASIRAGRSPRQHGENLEHTRMLARIQDELPPILVMRADMRVIDGVHRLGAARLRGAEMIAVQFFQGSEQEAYLLAVRANTTHGLPLSAAERSQAVEEIIRVYPNWSDRAIAEVAGLSSRTVANVRRRLDLDPDTEVVRARTGRDGRVRPLDNAEGRLRASALIREHPEASLREIARYAGVSPSTVRDVRARLARGDDPVPAGRSRRAGPATGYSRPSEAAVGEMLEGLRNDPSLRFSESGRRLLRWIFSRTIHTEERLGMADEVPQHCTHLVADLARSCAVEWLQFADELEHRRSDF